MDDENDNFFILGKFVIELDGRWLIVCFKYDLSEL